MSRIIIINNYLEQGKKSINTLEKIVKKYGFENETIYANDYLDLERYKQGYIGAILSGGSLPITLSTSDEESINKNIAANLSVLYLDIPVLGICMGHQVIGVFYGSELRRMEKRVDGLEEIHFLKKDPLLKGLKSGGVMEENHIEEIVNIPEIFLHLGYSKSCEIEIIKHKDRPLYGVQFHPEKSGKRGERLIKNFLDICRKARQ